ncbi:hypothetical protein [Acidiphilium sp.]|uniref:hypothetical protein n=1 Tax=Acidiphilium sp. TaxID=527 RepID=UPI002590635D|nr:hypothetical protein [Acidiphilium sp.]
MAGVAFALLFAIFLFICAHVLLSRDERDDEANTKSPDVQSDGAEPPPVTSLEKAEATIRALEAVVADTETRFAELEIKYGELISSRQDAHMEILALKAELAEAKQFRETGGRFGRLKSLVIRELHPDGRPDAGIIERTVRIELFKNLWPEIEKIEQSA